ncbi:MAG: peptide chain release factor 1 [Cyanobacteria bacterium J06632_3]
MSNPFRSLKYLPWSELFLSAGVTVAIATVLDYLFYLLLLASTTTGEGISIALPAALTVLITLLLPAIVSVGIGVLSIFITARFFRQIILTAGTMWALIGCVLVLLFVRQFLPIPGVFVGGVDYFSMMGIVVGAFTYGRRYWR